MYIKNFCKNTLLCENLAKAIKCTNSLSGFEKTHQKQRLHPELDVIN
jgi:hypothetical protein